jgi:hypothetical protein
MTAVDVFVLALRDVAEAQGGIGKLFGWPYAGLLVPVHQPINLVRQDALMLAYTLP